MLAATSLLPRCPAAAVGGASRASSGAPRAILGRTAAARSSPTGGRWPAATRAVADGESGGVPTSGGPVVASPFSSATVHRCVGAKTDAPKAAAAAAAATTLSIAAVDACLDEVRPYLIADGGDVEVTSADPLPAPGRVALRLRGACSSCSSSDATMKMGLERAIRARFGAGVVVVQVTADGAEAGGGGAGGVAAPPAGATREAVDRHLDMLRGAVAGLGGRVRVAAVAPIPEREGKQRAVVWYKGPRSIGNGIKAAILERFPGDVVEVELADFPPGGQEEAEGEQRGR